MLLGFGRKSLPGLLDVVLVQEVEKNPPDQFVAREVEMGLPSSVRDDEAALGVEHGQEIVR